MVQWLSLIYVLLDTGTQLIALSLAQQLWEPPLPSTLFTVFIICLELYYFLAPLCSWVVSLFPIFGFYCSVVFSCFVR